MARKALLVVAVWIREHAVGKLPVGTIRVIGDCGEGSYPLCVDELVLMGHVKDGVVQDEGPYEVTYLSRKTKEKGKYCEHLVKIEGEHN